MLSVIAIPPTPSHDDPHDPIDARYRAMLELLVKDHLRLPLLGRKDPRTPGVLARAYHAMQTERERKRSTQKLTAVMDRLARLSRTGLLTTDDGVGAQATDYDSARDAFLARAREALYAAFPTKGSVLDIGGLGEFRAYAIPILRAAIPNFDAELDRLLVIARSRRTR